MDVLWLSMVAVMLGGWFVFDGANHGLGMSLRRMGSTSPERRLLLTALGPFLLAGEVWLIAAAGLLIGAFPGLEHDLVGAFYPLFAVVLVGWVLRDAGVWFRSRRPSPRWRGGWERIIVVASTTVAFVWGLLLGNVAQGVPHGEHPELGRLLGPYPIVWGVTVVAVFTLHGALFSALRLPIERGERAAGVSARWWLPAAILLGLVVVSTPLLGVDPQQPVPALGLLVVAIVAVVLAGRFAGARRDGRAYAATAIAALAMPLAVGVGVAPRLLEGAAGPGTLELLTALALPVVPVLILAQAGLWWTFRRRVSAESAVFF